MNAFKSVITAKGEADLVAIYQWYEEQQVGLGTEFFAGLTETVSVVCGTPKRRASGIKASGRTV